MRSHRIAPIPGDGIGKGVVAAGLCALAVCALGIARIPGDDIGVPERRRHPPLTDGVRVPACGNQTRQCFDQHL